MSTLTRPMYYHRDGTPIIDNELFPATIQWALLFEQSESRIVGNTRTIYGERLSTVFLGLDHNYSQEGPPILFETMLFGPKPEAMQNRQWNRLREFARTAERAMRLGRDLELPEETEQEQREEERFKRRFPHDQLQLRYTTENEARDSHETLMLQCLIPPRWRHFLLWTIGRQQAWRYWDDEDEED